MRCLVVIIDLYEEILLNKNTMIFLCEEVQSKQNFENVFKMQSMYAQNPVA